ncbi:MAG: DNA repair ATPase [Terrimicrobiaceae bacterium]
MADQAKPSEPANPEAAASGPLGSATYEIIRQRLTTQTGILRERMGALDARRQEVFGSVESKLLRADRVNTAHNCIPKDMVQLGDGRFLFGFNIRFGLKKVTELGDVFAIYAREEESFREDALIPLQEKAFLSDFQRIHTVYEKTTFSKFSLIEGHLYMVFQTGSSASDIAVFKWAVDGGTLRYVDGRAEAEYRRGGFPPQHNFRWSTPDRESYRYGDFPHISIEERVFVECVGGNLTVKVEDNTKRGEGIYSEPVDDKRQKVDDADMAYAILGHLILLKIRPYKEQAFRYLIFNEKTQAVIRVDSIGQSCAALPEDHGIIFPDGYYLGTGELKLFGSKAGDHTLERTIHAPNGEDSLYVFYSMTTGEYVLLPYKLIAQKVEERITCHGFSLFPNGHLVLFRGDNEPQKHHMIQLRQTPFYQPGFEPAGKREAFLYQVGNRDVVRCLAESNEILALAGKDNPYAELYTDLVTRCTGILDGYPWLSSEEGFGLDAALKDLREASNRAVDEFDKVLRLQRDAVGRVEEIQKRTTGRFQEIRRAGFKSLDDFVRNLAALRSLTGELITLREVRYIDITTLENLGKQVAEESARLSEACVTYLLKPEALEPYRVAASGQLAAAESVKKVSDAKTIEAGVSQTSTDLEMLIEIVNSLKIGDATETTRIIDDITAVYTTLNQVRGALKNQLHTLVAAEGAAQFSAQMKLLGQSAASYLDLCDTPAKCEEYLNRISVQIEEMEGAFADFDEFIVQISDRRTELYEAFEQRKVVIIEARNKRASALMTAADRILKVVGNRLATFKTVEEIHSYLASDMMISKVRETATQLLELGDSVKSDDLTTRLKSLGQEAVRQLKDRQELFKSGPGVIQLGRHAFNVNTQPLDLTVVHRDGGQFIHLTGTRYFDPITSPEFLATRAVWDQEFVSENRDVYRAETLASHLLRSLEAQPDRPLADIAAMTEAGKLTLIQEFMAGRYEEGYIRGIHDLDGARLFQALLEAHLGLELARYRPQARALAVVFWLKFYDPELRAVWEARLKGFAEKNRIFPGDPTQRDYIENLRVILEEFAATTKVAPRDLAAEAAEYLFLEITGGETFVCAREGDELVSAFRQHLVTKGGEEAFRDAMESLTDHPLSQFELIKDWLRGFLIENSTSTAYLDEAAAVIFCGDALKRKVVTAATRKVIEGLKGTHPHIEAGVYTLDYLNLRERLDRFEQTVVPQFRDYHSRKQALIEKERAVLRLKEFVPKVLTSFVRNQLIDHVYLPLVGDNLAKQIGTAGDSKRTDRSGLLLLVSPPGYGKTTLLEYLASRLGIVFVKINGPAIGFATTSLDPEEAPNAAAREEIQKLNLALEMGDNVMICVDDIQHCHAEFLQKFISLCDAQRKIEGVWRGRSQTYDLRGRKVVVVMAGNPYTETGQKFRLPDMLANRADTYNLGDIIGGNDNWFKASYIENAVTSNSVLAPIANRSQKDIRTFLKMAESGERDTFEASYSSQEVEEVLSVLKKLITIREVILAVNQEYIRSAAQADEFRTEPPFKLQGSYRNMNRLTEKIVAIMNDQEVQALILDHYRNESQTLTTDTEANLLKLRELLKILTPEEATRW